MVTATLPDLNTLTLDALKALIVAQHERLLTREREVELRPILPRDANSMDFAVRTSIVRLRTHVRRHCRVHRIPHPTSVTIAIRPSCEAGWPWI